MPVLDQINKGGTIYEIVPEIAELFSTTKVYHTGDHVIYEAGWYTFKTDKYAGAWDATKVNGPFKVTNQISELKEDLTALTDLPLTWVDNYYLASSDGSPHSNNAYTYTDYIDLGTIRKELLYSMVVFSNIATYVLYDKDKNVVSISHTDSSAVITVTDSLYVDNDAVRYVRFSTQKTDNKYVRTGRAFLEEIAPDSVATKMLKDESVTIEKAKFIVHNEETNFVDVSALIQNRYINAYGVETSAPNWYCTDYIPLTPGKTYYKNDYVYKSYYGFYDADKNVVGCSHDDGDLGKSVGAFTLPNNAVYGRFSFNGAINAQNLAYISINRGEPKPYDYTLDISTQYPTDYNGNDIAVFNKILCIGNSLTYGGFNSDTSISTTDKDALSSKYSYPSQLQKITGVSTTNKGDSGKTTAQWYSAHSADDLSGHDCCIIELGTNDGTWSSASATAMDSIIAKVKAENKGIKIFVSTIPRGRSYNTDAYKAINTGIRNYVNALADSDVILIDVAEYGHVIESIGYNAGHLSAYGYWRLAKDYANCISDYMHNHMDSFRFVQFVGTDYTYSS